MNAEWFTLLSTGRGFNSSLVSYDLQAPLLLLAVGSYFSFFAALVR